MNGNCLKKIIRSSAKATAPSAKRLFEFLRVRAFTEAGIVSIFLLLLSVSMLFLDVKIGQDLDADTGKNWWTLSFETRAPDSLTFAIENHSEKRDFSYSIVRDKVTIDSGTVSVETGERKKVMSKESAEAGRTTILVEGSDGSKKSIYRER